MTAKGYDKILKKVLANNKPKASDIKRVRSVVNEFISMVNKRAQNLDIDVTVVLGGSVAKGTFLKDSFDSDVFFRFNSRYDDDKLSDMLGEILEPFNRKKYGFVRIHGSRDYFQLIFKDVKFELVPVLRVKEAKDVVNVTDASPMHVEWIRSRLKKSPRLRDEILLAKIFFKAQGLYGAESYIKGISGHVSDILVIYYGGFLKFLKAVSQWEAKQRIDIAGHGKRLNTSKTQGPLTIIDPVQPDRNAAAALCENKYNHLKEVAKAFLDNPSDKYFMKKKTELRNLKKRAYSHNLFILDIAPLEGKEDVVGCKLLKVHDYIVRRFGMDGFTLIDSGWEWDKARKAMVWFIVRKDRLAKELEWIGPPVNSRKHVIAFRNKHADTYVKDGYMCATILRRFTTPLQMIRGVMKDEYVKQRVKRCSLRSY